MKKIIGERIATARKAIGISQNELATITRVDQASISQYEAGNTEPTSSSLRRISWALKICTHDLLPPDDFVERLIEEEGQLVKKKIMDKIKGGKKGPKKK